MSYMYVLHVRLTRTSTACMYVATTPSLQCHKEGARVTLGQSFTPASSTAVTLDLVLAGRAMCVRGQLTYT